MWRASGFNPEPVTRLKERIIKEGCVTSSPLSGPPLFLEKKNTQVWTLQAAASLNILNFTAIKVLNVLQSELVDYLCYISSRQRNLVITLSSHVTLKLEATLFHKHLLISKTLYVGPFLHFLNFILKCMVKVNDQ